VLIAGKSPQPLGQHTGYSVRRPPAAGSSNDKNPPAWLNASSQRSTAAIDGPWTTLCSRPEEVSGLLADLGLIHVMEYIWSAAWCFFAQGDQAAEDWVRAKTLAVLEGNARDVAAGIRR